MLNDKSPVMASKSCNSYARGKKKNMQTVSNNKHVQLKSYFTVSRVYITRRSDPQNVVIMIRVAFLNAISDCFPIFVSIFIPAWLTVHLSVCLSVLFVLLTMF